ncbi:hypothetical protein KXX11_003743, partial [Aspergillus fumigatus]
SGDGRGAGLAPLGPHGQAAGREPQHRPARGAPAPARALVPTRRRGPGGGAGGAGLWRTPDGHALPGRHGPAAVARGDRAALLPVAHHLAHVHGAGRLAAVQRGVRGAGHALQGDGEGADPLPRHPAVHPHPGFSVDHRDRLHRTVPGQSARCRVRGHLRHLHLAGLEHGFQPVPVAEDRAGRAAGGLARVPDVG